MIKLLDQSGPADKVYWRSSDKFRVLPRYLDVISDFSPVKILETYYKGYQINPGKGTEALVGIPPDPGTMKRLKMVRPATPKMIILKNTISF